MSREYGLFIRNRRTGRWINLADFAKVLHHGSTEPRGSMADVPGMNHYLLPVKHGGNGRAVWHNGDTAMLRRPAADLGLTDAPRIWHAVTLISSDAVPPEGVADDLESVPSAGCLLNYEDGCFYTSPDHVQRRTRLPVRILMGAVYD